MRNFIAVICVVIKATFVAATPCFSNTAATVVSCNDANFQNTQTFPINLAEFTQLTSITIRDTAKFVGQIPSELGLLQSLKELNLIDTGVTGTLPTELGFLTSLEILSITGGSSRLHGTIPSQIGMLPALQTLTIQGHNLHGSIPKTFMNLKELTDLKLSRNSFSGTLSAELGQLSNIVFLHLDSNQIEGTIPREIFQLPKLRNLHLTDNLFTGTLPDNVVPNRLNEIFLGGCRMRGTIPEGFQVKPLIINGRKLSLPNNQFSGPIPQDLSSFNVVDLSHNKFTGTIPGTMSNKLTFLALSNNLLYGQLPSELSRIGDDIVPLNYQLYLDNNDFTGTLPAILQRGSSNTHVTFHNNRLNGTLPEWVGQLQNPVKVFPNNIVGPIQGGAGHILYCRDTACTKSFALSTITDVSETGMFCNSTVRCSSQRGVEQLCADNKVCCEIGTLRSCVECEPDTGRCLTPQVVKLGSNNATAYSQPTSVTLEDISNNGIFVVWSCIATVTFVSLLAYVRMWCNIRRIKFD